ncbi:hypothetical protein BDK92_0561 [Micromonospora pisi]|uniref:Uncharacterized protein n=1 Tax=Micromonospora pisi TaxID=589240 RepID=A0A495JBP2_9ACTN|nr:hypothetical protein [Micromonospora pisi]RKR86337.1 hypothetical protein BDK92_0561 [Micromonospora pisi]
MTTSPQRIRRNRSPLSTVAIRLGLLALVSYPVFPWTAESTVGAARSSETGRTSDPVGGGLPPRTPWVPCLTIVAVPDAAGLSVPKARCQYGTGNPADAAEDTPAPGNRHGSSYRGGFQRDRPDAGRPDQLDTSWDRAADIWAGHGPPVSGGSVRDARTDQLFS